jgi:hypothetical protein
MTRIMLLATAMVLMPVYAMASENQSDRPQAAGDSTQRLAIPRPSLPCTPLNPCAVPPPALGAVPDIAGMETQAHADAARQTR